MSRVVLFIALRQLWDRKLLNSIAVLGVALGVLVLIAINGIMQGFQTKFLENILRISPHVTMFDKQLRPLPSILSRSEQTFVAARVAHENPSDRQLRIAPECVFPRQAHDEVQALVLNARERPGGIQAERR